MISINLLSNNELEYEMFIPESIKDFIHLTDLMYAINNKKPMVTYEDFYNDGISKNVHPVHEIRNFRRKKKHPQSYSFSDHAYLLSCYFKSELLWYECKIE